MIAFVMPDEVNSTYGIYFLILPGAVTGRRQLEVEVSFHVTVQTDDIRLITIVSGEITPRCDLENDTCLSRTELASIIVSVSPRRKRRMSLNCR